MTGGGRRRWRVRYGPHRSQRADLHLPEAPTNAAVPVLVLLHGGFWRWPWSKALMRGLGADARHRGWATWNVEYRRLGRFGGGGGYPMTFDDVAAAVDHLARLPPSGDRHLDLGHVVVCGHSAGGTLAVWVAGRADGVVVPTSVVSLAGVTDLREADALGIGDHAVAELLGGGVDDVPDRYDHCSPAGRTLCTGALLVHGRADTVVPASMSARFVEQQGRSGAGVTVDLVLVDGGHRDLLRRHGAGWHAVVERVITLRG